MKKNFLCCVALLPAAMALVAQTPVKLSGTVIGTAECYDYGAETLSTTVNTAVNCFDNDFTTFFATNQRNEGWAGLDLGQKYVITEVKWCPRATQSDRVRLGVFEGANNPDFGDAVPLCVIPVASLENQLSAQTVNSSKGYRYVRYIGRRDVRCNVAELEFWGYPSDGDNSHVGQITGLPTVAIHTVNNQIIDSKENYVKGIISVIDGDYFHTDSLDIRGRGNASWGFPKKPYRVKLYKKTRLLGNPANEKNWTLINNYGDKSLMRNLIAFDISNRMEMTYTPAGRPVDVVLNGEYVGTYQLCDHIEVAGGRVDVEKMDEDDVALPDLSGGYLIEVDGYASNETEISWFASNNPHSTPVTVKYPKDDEIVPAQFDYIRGHFNTMQTAVFASNYTDATNGYRKYIDVPTFVRLFLIGELSGNTDTYWSVYMTKKRNDDKFYFGPVWDFDIAFENDQRTYPINGKTDWVYRSGGSSAGDFKAFIDRMLSDSYMLNEIKNTWAQYRNGGQINAEALGAVVDNYATQMNASQDLNFKRWNILNEYTHMMWARGDYANNVKIVKDYISARIAWIDNKLQYIPSSTTIPSLDDITVYSSDKTININNIKEMTEITCYDITGKIFFTVKTGSDYSRQLPAGVYLIKVTTQNAETKILKSVVY
ncbi:MAG: CotH kinase family protein [Prevotellaceae bacterium]|jgi:hypothetical protein|nr:CotH kinase family protein [Prevotellaceae bacterium]